MDDSRRSLIKRGAAGVGMIWATPVVLSVATTAAAGTPAPCDCEHPSTPPKSVGCNGVSHCHGFYCGAVIAPCDTVTVSCPDLACRFTFTASCGATRTGHTGGTITWADLSVPGGCDSFPVGGSVDFDYRIL